MRKGVQAACGLLAAIAMAGSVAVAQTEVHPTVIATGLQNPWALAFLPDGQMLVTERPGRLRLVSAQGRISEPVNGLPPIHAAGQGGLLDLVLDRDFESNRRLYFCFSEPDNNQAGSGANSTAMATARLSQDQRTIEDVSVIFRQMPKISSSLHFGCRIVQLADGSLLLGLGDRYGSMQESQNLSNHIGKIVRVMPDGSVPRDNPFVNQQGAAPEVWSYGHRNIQGAVIGDDGAVWMHEHGPQGGDEVNHIIAGQNYGWPVVTHGENYGGGVIGQGITAAPGMVDPELHWTPSIAPSGMAQITSDRYGQQWKGRLVAGSLKFMDLRGIEVQNGKVVSTGTLVPKIGQRVRDVRQGPDGLLYLLTDQGNGQLIRLDPVK